MLHITLGFKGMALAGWGFGEVAVFVTGSVLHVHHQIVDPCMQQDKFWQGWKHFGGIFCTHIFVLVQSFVGGQNFSLHN